MTNPNQTEHGGLGPQGGEPRDQLRAQDQQHGRENESLTQGGFAPGQQAQGEPRTFAEGDPGGQLQTSDQGGGPGGMDGQGGVGLGGTQGGQGEREAGRQQGREDLGQQNLASGGSTGQGSPGQDFTGRGGGQGEIDVESGDIRPDDMSRRDDR